MAWYAIYMTATGRLDSVGESETLPIISGKTALLLLGNPDLATQVWDETLKVFVARPAKVLIDRLDDVQNHPDYADFMIAFNALNATNRQRIRNGIIWLLHRYRFRNQNEGVRLE